MASSIHHELPLTHWRQGTAPCGWRIPAPCMGPCSHLPTPSTSTSNHARQDRCHSNAFASTSTPHLSQSDQQAWHSARVRHTARLKHSRMPPSWATAGDGAAQSAITTNQEEDDTGVYSLQKTQVLVETAMLAAVGGLAYLLSTILKLEGSLGYFLPLPIVLSAMRGGPAAGVKTMIATGFLLVVLLGPLRSLSYVLIHGLLAASLAALWRMQSNFWLCVVVGACVRMSGQLAYLVLSSVTMNENLFAIMMANVYAMLDQVCASMGIHGAPSPLAIGCMLFSLLLVNASCYVFLLQIIYRIILQSMGYQLGPLPGLIRKYLYAGMQQSEAATQRYG